MTNEKLKSIIFRDSYNLPARFSQQQGLITPESISDYS